MVSKVRVEGIGRILLLSFQGQIQGCFRSSFLPRNAQIWRWYSGVRILGPMSGVMNQCWAFSDLPSRGINLFFCYALTISLGIRPCE